MKLLFIGYLHGYGGAEKMLIMLANEMARRNHSVSLIGLAENNPCYTISDNVEYIFCKDYSQGKIGKIIGRFKSLKQIVSEINPDLIINFNFQSTYLLCLMGTKMQQKTIYAERGDPYDAEYSGIMGLLRKFVFNRIRGFVFQTSGACNCFSDKIKAKSCIIHNPIFIQQEETMFKKPRDKRIVTVGRLHEQKNQKLLINAWSKIADKFPDYCLEIYGSGELKEQLLAQIQQLRLQNSVYLMGSFSDIHKRISNASVFVLSSDYEGMPNALLEAMALGIPCISTDCRPGGARELISNNENGIIVPCNNVDSVVDAITYMLSEPALAEIMGNNAKKILEEHSPDSIYDKWESFFKKYGVRESI